MQAHITRLPYQREQKKAPPPMFGRWLLMLGVLLMAWGVAPQVVRANTDPDKVAETIWLEDNVITEERPYIRFRYMDYDKDNGKADAMCRIKIYVKELSRYEVVNILNKKVSLPICNDILVG